MKALLIYHTNTNHTKEAVEDIAKGLEKREVEVEILNVKDAMPERVDFTRYQILVIGTPTHVGGPAKKISNFISKLTSSDIENKRIGLVSCCAMFGGNTTVNQIEKILKQTNPNIKVEKVTVKAGAPASLWTGPKASEKDKAKCVELGERLGQ